MNKFRPPGIIALTLGLVTSSIAATAPAPIAPIEAPFPMPQLQRPAFPDREFNITNFGAVGDGITLNVENIQRAIEACHAASGGTVIVPAGRWLTTPLELKSRVRLHLAAGAEVVFTDEKKYYYAGLGSFTTPPRVSSQSYAPELTNIHFPRQLLAAYDCEDIAVTGPGRLDGQGIYWWPVHKAWLKKSGHRYPPEAVERAVRGLDASADYVRPSLIQFTGCRNVLLEGFTAVNSPFWTINPVACENLILRKLTVRAAGPRPDVHAPNTDGINPESCRNVLIEDCDIVTGDDSVAIKSGVDAAGRKRGIPSENIVLRHLHARRIAIGSEMSGGVRNVFIHDCQLTGGMNSILHIKSRRGRGGIVENIFMQDIEAGRVSNAVVRIDMEYWTHVNPAPPEPLSERTPHIRNLFFKNLLSTAPSPDAFALYLNGLPEAPLENVTFENLRLDTQGGIVCKNVQGITFKAVALTTTVAPVIAITNGQELSFPGLAVATTNSPFLKLEGKNSRAIRFDAVLASLQGKVLLADGATSEAVKFDLRRTDIRATPRPNIVMIVSDDHGRDALGCYGNPAIKTPNLDALARDGIRFTSAFCTTASCSPSRSVILSGLQNHRNGMYGLQHQEHHFQSFDNVKSLPVLLAEAGYRTARIGKYHIAPESVFKFETVLSGGTANDPASIGRSPVVMADAAKEFISATNDQPFFLYFATDDPHRANAVLPDGRPTFETYPKPNSFGNRPQGYPGIMPVTYQPEQVIVPPFLPDTSECRAELAEYYQSVSRFDQGVGKLVETLKAAGKYDNTLILYISDNGPAFPGAKTTLYDPGIRLPCIIRSPRQPTRGIVEDAMISWADLTPTILDFVGVAPPKGGFDGKSFRPALEGGHLLGWDEVYASHSLHEATMYYPMRMVRTRNYKLVWNVANELTYPSALDLIYSPTWISAVKSGTGLFGKRRIENFLHRPRFELYDLNSDPNEVKNLTDDAAIQEIKAELVSKLKSFQQRTNDPWIHKWEYE